MKYFARQLNCTAYEIDPRGPLTWGVLDSKGGFRPCADEASARAGAERRNAAVAARLAA